jgi:SPP1 gp7 family putative phage head morphogenesis protein
MVERQPFLQIVDTIASDPAFGENRAFMIARTETNRIANGARLDVAKEIENSTGRTVLKTWLSSRDDRVRDEHIQNDDGEWYQLDYEWPTGSVAPDEPNCRCQLLTQMQD